MHRAVVIGSSPSGLRAAAWLARRGVEVRYLSTAATASGLTDGPVWGLGAAPVRGSGDVDLLSAVWGPVLDLPEHGERRGVWLDGGVQRLPLSRRAIARLLGVRRSAEVSADLARARFRNRLEGFISMGQEERCYATWLEHRLGPGVVASFHEPYARQRFGTDAAEVTSWLAWRTHGRPGPERWVVPPLGPDELVADHVTAIRDSGGDVLDGVVIEGIEVEDGRVRAVVTEHGRELVDELLWVDATAREVAGWLPDGVVDDTWRFDLGRLHAHDAVQVSVPARAADLPWILHLPSGGVGWRLTRPGLVPGGGRWNEYVTAHLTVPQGDRLAALSDEELVTIVRARLASVVEPTGRGGVVQRITGWVPSVTLTTQPSLARRLEAYDWLGIVGVGPRGGHRIMDVTDEIALLDAIVSAEVPTARRGPTRAVYQREAHRQVFERPVRLPENIDPRIGVSD